MQVKEKIFPYPILNNNKALSNFNNKEFKIIFEPQEKDNVYVLRNCRFETNSEVILNLYNEKKIGIVLIVECSDTVYRKAFEISMIGRNYNLPKVDFSEKVDISMFAYAKENFYISSDEFDEDYRDIGFEIEKYDIIAANDGFNVRFRHEDIEDNFVQSIFSVIANDNLEAGAYQVECNIGKKITISLALDDYKNYKVIYTFPAYKEVFFNMILVPSLIEGLTLCKDVLSDETKDMDDIGNQYTWFRSIQNAYKKLKGTDLQIQDFKSMSPVLLAQELLGRPFGHALDSLVKEANEIIKGDNDYE